MGSTLKNYIGVIWSNLQKHSPLPAPENPRKTPFYLFIRKYYSVLIILLSLLFLSIYFSSETVHAQKRLDLDDLEVKGELLNDDRLNILARDRNELRNYVKFRTNFRSEIVEELPQPDPGIRY